MNSATEYRPQVVEYGTGERSLEDLPLADPGFWSFVIRIAARPGRNSERAPFIGAAAESLLRQNLTQDLQAIRESAAFELLRDSNTSVRRVAIERIAGSANEHSYQELKRAALGGDKELAIQAVRLLGRTTSPEACAALADVLAESSDLRTTLAAEALIEDGSMAIPYLERLLDRPDRMARWRAVSCLVAMKQEQALAPLLEAFRDESTDIAWLAADGLLALGPSVRVDVLRWVLKAPIKISTARALRHYAEHSSPRRVFKEIVNATRGLASLSAIPVSVEHALEAIDAGEGTLRRS